MGPHVVQGLDVGVRAQPGQGLLDLDARLGVLLAGQHLLLLLLQLLDLGLEGQQRLLGVLGLVGGLLQLALDPRDIGGEGVLALDEVQGDLVLALVHCHRDLLGDLPELGLFSFQLLGQLVAQVDDVGDGLLEILVLPDPAIDRRHVHRLGVTALVATDPEAPEAVPQVRQSIEESSTVGSHGVFLSAALRVAITRPYAAARGGISLPAVKKAGTNPGGDCPRGAGGAA